MKIPDKRPRPKIMERFICSHFFKPDKELLTAEISDQINIPIREHSLQCDKLILNGWEIPAEKPKGTIVFFHGSTGTNTSWKMLFYYLQRSGYNIWSFDYAGYGKSQGISTFSTFNYDIELIFNYIQETSGKKMAELILFGHSLGCFAVQQICQLWGQPFSAILQSPIFSLELLLSGKIPGFMLNYFRINQFSLQQLYHSEIKCHILIGEQDTLIPVAYGTDLWKDRQHTNLLVVPEYKHASFIKPYTQFLDTIL